MQLTLNGSRETYTGDPERRSILDYRPGGQSHQLAKGQLCASSCVVNAGVVELNKEHVR